LLRAFDPVEMAGVIEMMQQQLDRQSEQLNQTFEQLGREIAERQQVNQAEVELREQQQLLERVTESTSALLYIYDLVDRRNAYVNAQITNLLGYSPEEIQAMGSNLFANLVHPDDLPKLLTQLDRCFRAADGEIIESEYRMRDVNGDWHWLQSRDSVLNRNADGTPKQAIGTAIDITERQQAEAKIREQAVLLDISTDAIYVRDLNDCILYWNQGAEKVYGWSAAEALGRPSEELFDTDPAQREVALATTLEKGSWQGELLKTTQSGKAIVLDSRWSLMKNEAGQPHAILTVSSDITDKKQLEAQYWKRCSKL
jgi:PAS domain S-box-containing protein